MTPSLLGKVVQFSTCEGLKNDNICDVGVFQNSDNNDSGTDVVGKMVIIKTVNIIRMILLLLSLWALFTEANDYDPWWANAEYSHQIRAKPAAGRNGRKKFGGKGFITTAVAVGPGKK